MSEVKLITQYLLPNLRKVIIEEVRNRFKKCEKVAVKCHMGEYGNLYYVRPPIIELIVDELKKIGVEPFLFDSPALYTGDRDSIEKYYDTARKNGFTPESMGCPILISETPLSMKSKYFNNIEIVKELYEVDGMVVVSHFKSHELTTFGGSIKNIGMGGISKKSKASLHKDNMPEVGGSCTGCETCVAVCPEKAIEIKDGRAVINSDKCFGCCNCIDYCPNDALTTKKAPLVYGLAEVCSYYCQKFKDKIYYVNVLLDINDKCDCYPLGGCDIGKIIAPNIGIITSDDIVAIDKASLDLVQKASDNKFGEVIKADPEKQIKAGLEFGLGSDKYKLVNIKNL